MQTKMLAKKGTLGGYKTGILKLESGVLSFTNETGDQLFSAETSRIAKIKIIGTLMTIYIKGSLTVRSSVFTVQFSGRNNFDNTGLAASVIGGPVLGASAAIELNELNKEEKQHDNTIEQWREAIEKSGINVSKRSLVKHPVVIAIVIIWIIGTLIKILSS